MLTRFLESGVLMGFGAIVVAGAGCALAAAAHLRPGRYSALEPVGGALFIAGLVILGTAVPFV